jgi:hypothetical protein
MEHPSTAICGCRSNYCVHHSVYRKPTHVPTCDITLFTDIKQSSLELSIAINPSVKLDSGMLNLQPRRRAMPTNTSYGHHNQLKSLTTKGIGLHSYQFLCTGMTQNAIRFKNKVCALLKLVIMSELYLKSMIHSLRSSNTCCRRVAIQTRNYGRR